MKNLQHFMLMILLVIIGPSLLGQPFDSQKFSGRDNMGGWNWDGTTASYIAVLSGKSTLYVRGFDGNNFGPVRYQEQVSGASPFRGWSWRNGTASYLAYTGGKTYLFIRPFSGSSKMGTVQAKIEMSGRDNFLSWHWDGDTAIYHAEQAGSIVRFKRAFNGSRFLGPIDQKVLDGPAGASVRGFSITLQRIPNAVIWEGQTTIYPSPPPPQIPLEQRTTTTVVFRPWGYTIVMPPNVLADFTREAESGMDIAGKVVGTLSVIPGAGVITVPVSQYMSHLIPWMNDVDEGKGVYLSATWALPNFPIPTPIK